MALGIRLILDCRDHYSHADDLLFPEKKMALILTP